MKIDLNENERIEDLQINDLKIIQNKTGFCFGIDSVLLSDFAKEIKENARVLDLGTGTGIISILLCHKTKLREIIGVKIKKEVYDMAQKSIKINKLENKFKILNEDVLNLENIIEKNSIDAIVTNPPYEKKNAGIKNCDKKQIISRHETTATLDDFIRISKTLLKDKGEFYMVHKPHRLVDILYIMRKYKIEPKLLRLVYSNYEKEPKLVLVKGIKNGNSFLKVQNNLYIYDKNGNYTDEINRIYNK